MAVPQGRPAVFLHDFLGPPGSGKTTLARIMAGALHCQFVSLSAVMSGVADLRRVVEEARRHQNQGTRTVVLIDEIHRLTRPSRTPSCPTWRRD